MRTQNGAGHYLPVRWTVFTEVNFEKLQEAFDSTMLKMGKLFARKYTINIYELNKKALIIQHWFFKHKHELLKKHQKLINDGNLHPISINFPHAGTQIPKKDHT